MDDLKISIQTIGNDGIEYSEVSGDKYSEWIRRTVYDGGSPRHVVRGIMVSVNMLETYGVEVPLFHLEVETGGNVFELYRGQDGKIKFNER